MVTESWSRVARPFSRRALSIRDDKRLSSLMDIALREKGSGRARLTESVGRSLYYLCLGVLVGHTYT